MPVPDSQLRGSFSCRLSLFSYTGTPSTAGVAQQARAWLTPVQCYNKIPWDAMKLNKAGFNVPESYSLLKMPPVGCLISALKKRKTGKKWYCDCLIRQNRQPVRQLSRSVVR